jgi:tRNA G10  N-methylase Trm11
MDCYYVIHHMKEFVRDKHRFTKSEHVKDWGRRLQQIQDEDLAQELRRIQLQLATVINKDVFEADGVFHGSYLTMEETQEHLRLQHDKRPFMLDGIHTFLV